MGLEGGGKSVGPWDWEGGEGCGVPPPHSH